ncbi:MAG: gliding motility-associated C-terminal domain-containing protein [Bacteroidetes bacterium]|nr:gliding motility-associated C-terminal domain-containing protein [Bacteroidota bacterium]
MDIKLYATIFLFTITCKLGAAEPTIAATNLVIDNINCTSARVSWTNGNGSWRIVLIKEASAVNTTPADGVRYTSSATFGAGSELGTGNYVCYNGASNIFTVSGLQPNKTYHIAVFEHDAAAPDYFTSTYPSASFTTKFLNLDFSYSYTDSCQKTNNIIFKNNSTTDLTGVTYTWYFKDGNQATGFDVQHSYQQGGYFAVQIVALPSGGCPNSFTTGNPVRIIPRPVSKPIEKNGNYSQCFTGNHFYFNDQTSLAPVPKCAYIRTWYFSTSDIATFPTPDRVYSKPGTYRIFFEAETLYDNNKTGCKDTTSLVIKVIADPSTGVTVNSDTVQCLKGNEFDFDNVNPGVVSYDWDFDDGGTSTLKQVKHTYNDIGEYHVLHKAASVEGCKSQTTKIVFVKSNTTANYSGLPAEACEGDLPLTLIPTTSGGIWTGSNLTDSIFNPSNPGLFSIKYLIPDTFCPDSLTKSILVKPLPKFSLGADENLCDGGTKDLTVNVAKGQILWDDGSTAATRTIGNAGKYWAQVTDSGCVWKDDIELFVGYTPIVKLPNDTSLCRGSILQLDAEWPNSTYAWSNNSKEKSIYVTSEGLYTVTVTNPCGVASDDIRVYFQGDFCDVFIPDAFTPNGDGKNEYFEILGKNITPRFFVIYDRWGAKVFDSRTDNSFRWDGFHNGLPCGDAMYSYVFAYDVIAGDHKRKNTIKGSVLLYR